MDNRRDFIKKATLLSGATGLSTILPDSISKALAIEPEAGSTYLDAEHIVILMQENRSFDHCFGNLKGVRGYNDPRAIDLPDKNKVWLQSDHEGNTFAPFHLDMNNTRATWMHSLPHSFKNQVNARNEGRFNEWINSKRSGNTEFAAMPLTMGYHTRADIPFYYSLADAFTVCDQSFCSSLTGTNPNRLFFWSGTVRDQQNETSRANVWNEDMDYGTLNWKTFPERLEEQKIAWKCYQNEMSIDIGFKGEQDPWLSNFQDNPLEFFAQYNIHLHDKHLEFLRAQLADLSAEIATLNKQILSLPHSDALVSHLQKQLTLKQAEQVKLKKNDSLLSPGKFAGLSDHAQNLHLKAFNTNSADPDYHELTDLVYDDNGTSRTMKVPKGDVLHQFRADVKEGKLPMVSWLTAPENFSDHPTAPWYGAWYVSEVMDILTQNPDVWKKTIFILTYDENDGYFDHIPPFTAPHSHKAGTGKVSAGIDTRPEFVTLEQEEARHDFPEAFKKECSIGLGYRVPMIIASPWSRGGFVNSEVFDHTSTLQFLESFIAAKTGKVVKETNISDWRRTICGDLTSVFRPADKVVSASPVFVQKDSFLENLHSTQFKDLPSDFKALSVAEIAVINHIPAESPLMPRQEPGIRPACALPYQMHADGMLSAGKKAFQVTFSSSDAVFGKRSAGAPFNVYAPGNYINRETGVLEPVRTWAYGLSPRDQLTDLWPLAEFENSRYHLRIYGPNGFYREFSGSEADPELATTFEYQPDFFSNKKLTGNIELTLNNLHPSADYTVEIIDNAYKAVRRSLKLAGASGAGSKTVIVMPLGKNSGWYDFSIIVQGHENFQKRYAGHVETGKTSFSDPLMGGVI